MGGRGASSSGSTSRESFIRDIVKNYDDFTRGDLQGAVEAYVMKKGMTPREVNTASNRLLKEIDDRHNAKGYPTEKEVRTALDGLGERQTARAGNLEIRNYGSFYNVKIAGDYGSGIDLDTKGAVIRYLKSSNRLKK